ncbi:unnamed protein product [Paramecium octaurelia]|uniref:Uncharacterized protein n=1 Tax=Paramecium octaurelia TaxID=43137 RepID=A0A8S1WSB5_PAROT|nr:unnamed protein product [Paramecium octaurelia]
MFQQHINTIQTCRSNSSINYIPQRLARVATPSGFNNNSAFKKIQKFHKQIEFYKQKEIYKKKYYCFQMKSHIQQLEESKSYIQNRYEQKQSFQSIQQQIKDLTQYVQNFLGSFNQRITEIENLRKSHYNDHTGLEKQIIFTKREHIINEQSNCFQYLLGYLNQKRIIYKAYLNVIPNEIAWKQRFIKLNKEYVELQEKYTLLSAELENNRINFGSPSFECFEAIIRQ